MRVLNTLYVRDHRASVGLQKGALLVKGPDGSRTRVPLNALEGVVMVGSGQITTEAMARCVERNIRICSLRRNGKVRFVVGGPTSGNVHLRVAQLRAATDVASCLSLARTIVAGKLQNYRLLLQRWSWDTAGLDRRHLIEQQHAIEDRLRALPDARDGDAIRGMEGDGTRRYFKGVAAHLSREPEAFRYMGRTRRPPRDPVNALLSFAYALVLTEITGALESVGLDPQIGFLHGLRPGRPSLSLDLLEEFRPTTADRFALKMITLHRVREVHFVATLGGACYLTDDGREIVIEGYEEFKDEEVVHRLLGKRVPRWSLPTIQATLLARHLRGDLPAYPPHLLEP